MRMPAPLSVKNIFIISGPSGAGEDSVINGVAKLLPIERVITTSTRSPRKGESNGNPYYFISPEEFQKKIARGEFVEYAQEYGGEWYGVTREELERVSNSGNIGLWKIEYQGVRTARKLFPGIVAILITAPLDIMEDRIRRRGNMSEAAIQERMAYTKEWLDHHTDIYDYTIENEEGKLNQTILSLKDILQKIASA